MSIDGAEFRSNTKEFFHFRACLIATVQSSEVSQSTIKLVATNLIAHGKIWEGVQLLCLIGKGLDACRYLTSYSRWGAAAWLARAVLRPSEAVEVIRKWADHLSSQGYKVTNLALHSGGFVFFIEFIRCVSCLPIGKGRPCSYKS